MDYRDCQMGKRPVFTKGLWQKNLAEIGRIDKIYLDRNGGIWYNERVAGVPPPVNRKGGQTMEPKFFKIPVCVGDVTLRVAKGHFATRHSHINYFIDVTRQQSCLQEAEAVAQQLAQRLQANTMVDTILCMDGTRVIGTCLARQLTQEGGLSVNAGKEIYLLRENVSSNGKLIFRDNARFMLDGHIFRQDLPNRGLVLQKQDSVRRLLHLRLPPPGFRPGTVYSVFYLCSD